MKLDNLDLTPNAAAIDLWKSQKDYACFLPSISAIYAKIVSMPEYNVRDSMPAGLPGGRADLNFLDTNNPLFYYPVALYSAGHAYLDVNDSNINESMIQKRDRSKTVIIGDSGGFQIATGVLKWPWEKKKNQTDLDWMRDKDKLRMAILRWLEATADYSSVLDVPTYGLVKFGFDKITGESLHPGMKTFSDCLNVSLDNYDFFIKHRVEGATKFLNVLQGRNQEEGDIWWNAVKDLPFETWAFSNVQASNFAVNLRRLIIMRDGKYLDGRDWLHYLGNGKIKAGCALTTLQRGIRKYINPDITISYDAASPFVMTAMGQIVTGYDITSKKISFKNGTLMDSKELKGSQQNFNDWIAQYCADGNKSTLIRSRIGDAVTVGDVCIRGYDDLDYKKLAFTKAALASIEYQMSPEGKAGDKFKWTDGYKNWLIHGSENGGMFDFGGHNYDKEYEKYQVKWPSSMDGFSYLLAMNHNVELHIRAIQAACDYQDQPTNIAKQHITSDLLEWRDLCPEILKSERPMDLINNNRKMLSKITGMDATYDIPMNIGDI